MGILLFELVKSMTINEKVYFKRNAKIHSGNEEMNYLKIYHFFEKSKKFDKKKLSEYFKGSTIEKYLSSEINYLKEKILISLFNYNMNRTTRNQIQKGILLIESLAAKGFQKEALKKLKSIKKAAIKQEEFTWILRLIELEEILIFREGIIGYKDNLEQLEAQRSRVISIIQNVNKYHILRQEIRELQFSNQLFNNDFKGLKEIYNNPLMVDDKDCQSIRAKEHWYYIHVLLNYLKRDFRTSLNISFEYVTFMNKNIHLFDNNKILPALSNYIYQAALDTNKKHFENGKKLLLGLLKKKNVSTFYIKYILYTRNLEYSYNTNDTKLLEENLATSIRLIEDDLAHFEESQIQYLFMGIIRATIALKQYDKGIYYSNLWYQRGVLPYRKVQARLFSLIIHFELNYLELIEAEIILLKKLAKKHLREKALIQCFYKFFNSILYHPEERENSIKIFQKKLASISKNNKGYFSFISFDYYQWSLSLRDVD